MSCPRNSDWCDGRICIEHGIECPNAMVPHDLDARRPPLTANDMYGPGYGVPGSRARFELAYTDLDREVAEIQGEVAEVAAQLKSIPWDARFVRRGLVGWLESYTHREEAERVPAGRPVPLNPNQDHMVEDNRGLIAAEQPGLPGCVCLSWPDEPAHRQELQSERRRDHR